jgi:hypothetical protein
MAFEPLLLAGQEIWQLRLNELIDVLRGQLRGLLLRTLRLLLHPLGIFREFDLSILNIGNRLLDCGHFGLRFGGRVVVIASSLESRAWMPPSKGS